MTDLLFIRHPETDMAGTFCGQADPPVNAAGYRQVGTLIENLRIEPITAIVTSDLQRAFTAARIMGESFAVPYRARRDLREIGFGDWEGLTWNQIEALDLAFAQRWLDQFPHLAPPRGESFHAFEARVVTEIRYLIEESKNGLIAVVTHAGVMRVVLEKLCAIDATEAVSMTRPYCCSFHYSHYADAGKRIQELHV